MEPAEKACPKKFAGHVFTDEERIRLIAGETIHVSDFTSKQRNKAEGDVFLEWHENSAWGDRWEIVSVAETLRLVR